MDAANAASLAPCAFSRYTEAGPGFRDFGLHPSEGIQALSEAAISGKRVLVTGATGFIGAHLCRRLASEGAHVLALERKPGRGGALAASGIEVVTGDITDGPRMEAILAHGVDVIVHLAAWLRGRNLREAVLVNETASRSLAEASVRHSVSRFVFTSSIAVYGLHGNQDVAEDWPLQTYGDPYGDSKIRAEAVLQQVSHETGLALVIVRPGMVYGPGSPGWTIRMARWARQGILPLVDGGRGTAYPIYIDNLLDLIMLCLWHPAAVGGVFNGVDDGPVTLAEYLGAYMKMAGTSRALRLPGWLVSLAAGALDPLLPGISLRYVASQMQGTGQVLNNRSKQLLGWQQQISLEEGLRRSEAWLRAAQYL